MPKVRPGPVAELPDLLGRWRADLAAWAIPEQITAAVTESPWVLPRQGFAPRADRIRAAPSGPSFERAWGALGLPLPPGTPSRPAADADADILDHLSHRAAAGGVTARTVHGRWPAVAA